MSQAEAENTTEAAPQTELEAGTYEIIRNRLSSHGKELRGRLDKLNHARKGGFRLDRDAVAPHRADHDRSQLRAARYGRHRRSADLWLQRPLRLEDGNHAQGRLCDIPVRRRDVSTSSRWI